MPLWKFSAVSTGFLSWALLTGVPAVAADKDKDKDSSKKPAASQVQSQIQQRIQSRQSTNPSSSQGSSSSSSSQSGQSRSTRGSSSSDGNSPARGQLQQQLQQRLQQSQPQGNSSSSGQPSGALRNLPNRGGQSTTDSKSSKSLQQPPGNQQLTLPPGRSPSGGALRDRLPKQGNQNQGNLPNAGGQTFTPGQRFNPGQNLSNDPAEQQLRQRLQQQLDAARQQPGKKAGDAANQDALRQRIEALKPQTGNAPGNADQIRDRLKNAPNLPQGPLQDRQPNLGNRLPNAGDRLPNIGGDRTPRLDAGKITGKPTVPLKVDKNGLLSNLKNRPEFQDQIKLGRDRIRNPDDLKVQIDKFQKLPELQEQLKLSNLKVTDLSGAFQTRVRRNDFTQLAQTNIGKQINLNQQFNLAINGDVARQLNLNQALVAGGGWAKRSVLGPVHAGYTKAAFSWWYPGPGFYPAYCWTPVWSPWVAWTFWDYCLPIYDPRPFWCRPIFYDPCPPIVYYQYPVWQPLPVVVCGTWVDVPPAIVDQGFDLQLLAVRFVDPGHKDEQLGPRYRVWVRNNSRAAIGGPFNVTLVAANGTELAGELPQAGVTVPEMDADTVLPIDIRLPFDANRMNVLATGQPTPFTHLHVLVDSHRDLQENDEANNGAILPREDILPVDPAAFSTDVTAAAPGSLVSLAGEGFGPEPGQVIVTIDGQQAQAEIFGWYDLGVHFKLPNIPVSGATPIDLLVIRGDGAASNPVTMSLTPQQLLGEAPLPPAPER